MGKSIPIEVCAYSLNACLVAHAAQAQRIELCASPWEGGTSPNLGMVQAALAQCQPEIHVMLRPRGGDFCYDATEKEVMRRDLELYLQAGVKGIVTGALLPDGDLDHAFIKDLKQQAPNLEWTFHRAIDVAHSPTEVLQGLKELGFTRILSSGAANRAWDGREGLRSLVEAAKGDIQIMAGSGVNPSNALALLDLGVDALHLSARAWRPSAMRYRNPVVSMGGLAEVPEYDILSTDLNQIKEMLALVNAYK